MLIRKKEVGERKNGLLGNHSLRSVTKTTSGSAMGDLVSTQSSQQDCGSAGNSV